MLPAPVFETKEVLLSDINLNPRKLIDLPKVNYCCPPTHPDSRSGILTRDSARLLLRLHPPVLWKSKNYCVLGRRVLHLAAPHLLRNDKIWVGYLPSATEDEVKLLMLAEPLINQIAFSTQMGSKGVFETSRKMDEDVIGAISPILNLSIETIAKMFSDCSPSTLFKLNAQLDADR